jgi:hypothetical protein
VQRGWVAETATARGVSGANYRTVCRAQTPKLFFSKLCIVLEEIDEGEGWLQTLITQSLKLYA